MYQEAALGRKPLLLDLFSGGGGAAMGYHRAGFEVVGVDIEPQPNYPFEFIREDAMSFPLEGYDAIHASPPCQRWTRGQNARGQADKHPDLLTPIRQRLQETETPWVIENVPGAPMRDPLMLCGTMFGMKLFSDGERAYEEDEATENASTTAFELRRHRWFEASFHLDDFWPITEYQQNAGISPGYRWGGRCKHRLAPAPVYGHGAGKDFYLRHGRGIAAWERKSLMQIDWMTGQNELSEAIPPVFTEHIGVFLLREVIRRGWREFPMPRSPLLRGI